MESLFRFATSISSNDNFARDVYIKSTLTIELDQMLKQIGAYNGNSNYIDSPADSSERIFTETPAILLLCDIFEAILLHGLKEKFVSRVSSVFGNRSPDRSGQFCADFWPVIVALCHSEELSNLKRLSSIHNNVGRCRAWLRSALNESLLQSYIDTLICDQSLLNNFYRTSAYIRDKQHTGLLAKFVLELGKYNFELSIDNADLNYWSNSTLKYLGIAIDHSQDTPVITALDAIHLLTDEQSSEHRRSQKSAKSNHSQRSASKISIKSEQEDSNSAVNFGSVINLQESRARSESEPVNSAENEERLLESEEQIDDSEVSSDKRTPEGVRIPDPNATRISCGSNSLSNLSGWSSQPIIHDESYDAILESYTNKAVVLSSTPDINDVRFHFNSPRMSSNLHLSTQSSVSLASGDGDFEAISKSDVFNKSDEDTKDFLVIASQLSHEHGLDEQDYKCHLCARPIGMIYGKSRLCHLDGHLYCTDCNDHDEALIPAQIMFNWNFRKCSVAKHNRKQLSEIEPQPLFDVKERSPLLYSVIDEMAETLQLRTQLFFLHAYLFTCQEKITSKMRKLVWPREHLFEHIHLYSINDFVDVHSGTLQTLLRNVITFARGHIFNCPLCRLKGYYCEICKNEEILYPFDTQTTRRCENCKSVFHDKCYEQSYDKNSCPKCLRLAKKQQLISTN